MPVRLLAFLTPSLLILSAPAVSAAAEEHSQREETYRRYLDFSSYVEGGSIEPNWMPDGSSFWYAEDGPDGPQFWRVDPESHGKSRLVDGPPFDETPDDDDALASRVDEIASPDRLWFASSRDHNVWLRPRGAKEARQLTTDGFENHAWLVRSWGDRDGWSPDGSLLAVKRVNARAIGMQRFPVVDWLSPIPEVSWVEGYPPAGLEAALTELFLLKIPSGERRRVGAWPNHEVYVLGWTPDSSELLFVRADREYKRFDLMAADRESGDTRIVISETHDTYVYGWDFPRDGLLRVIDEGTRLIWMSERDGWRHLYLYDLRGQLIRRLTQGAFPLVEILGVDERTGWVYFTAHPDPQRPYDTHLCRVSLEGEGFTRLTAAPGQHVIEMSPSMQYFLDTHSSVDRPPVVELRRADGRLLRVLSRADASGLEELEWSPPEEFIVRAADGETDLHGVLYKPFDFDPSEKYPVIQVVYGGFLVAQAVRRSFVPRLHDRWAYELAQAGFITFFVDPRGTAHRGKAFQDAFYGDIGSERKIADYVGTLRQLAAERPYMNLRQAGILGHSAGGYHVLRAMLTTQGIYRAGVASAAVAGSVGTPWEYYMGSPQNNPEGYRRASTLSLAGNLEGELLLIVGSSDVLFGHTMTMVDALTREDKEFHLMVLPGKGHSLPRETPYWRNTIRRFFEKHLDPAEAR